MKGINLREKSEEKLDDKFAKIVDFAVYKCCCSASSKINNENENIMS